MAKTESLENMFVIELELRGIVVRVRDTEEESRLLCLRDRHGPPKAEGLRNGWFSGTRRNVVEWVERVELEVGSSTQVRT